MGTKHVRLDEDFYDWVRSRSRESETFSETLERLTRRPDLLDIPEVLDEGDLEEAERAARQVRGRTDRTGDAREAFEQ
ncbi:MAG: hypothetical protein ABEJ61_11430 [Haloferacaceae archaeon]